MIRFLKNTITDEVYGKELENCLIALFGFSLFTVSEAQKPSIWLVATPAVLSALYVKYPTLQEILQDSKQKNGDSDE